MKRCFFIGHRYVSESIYERLCQSVETVIRAGVTEFIVGHYGAFDRLAAKAVKQHKAEYPVRLVMLLPYHPAVRPIELPEGFDGSYYPSGMEKVPMRLAIVQANRRAVKVADCLIAYVVHSSGNSSKIMEYARRQKKNIYNLAQEKEQA